MISRGPNPGTLLLNDSNPDDLPPNTLAGPLLNSLGGDGEWLFSL